MKKILYISGSLGLGHVFRDLEIARALRQLVPDIEISWIAEPPASDVLERSGEVLLPEAKELSSNNKEIENLSTEHGVNLIQWAVNMQGKGWAQNAKVYGSIAEKYSFDLWIGDEPYDLMIALVNNPKMKTFPFVVIYDFLGLDAVTSRPMDHIAAYVTNRLWSKFLLSKPPLADRSIFIGEMEDVPDKSFGFMLPNRRVVASKACSFVGYILSEDIAKYINKEEARKILGYGDPPLVLCALGGTAAGKNLLDNCLRAYPIAKNEIPDLRMVLVCGPRVDPKSIEAPEGVDIFGYVPNLYRHMGGADLSIVLGGGTVTLELTALQRPFLYFPLEQHFEQQLGVANRCKRYGAGVKMVASKTTPELLAKAITSNIGKHVDYPPIPLMGAQKAAEVIRSIL